MFLYIKLVTSLIEICDLNYNLGDLAIQTLKFYDLAIQNLKFYDLAIQTLKFYDLALFLRFDFWPQILARIFVTSPWPRHKNRDLTTPFQGPIIHKFSNIPGVLATQMSNKVRK